MKFYCEKYLLQNAVMTAGRAAASKSPIAALEGLLIQAGDVLKITGYDLKKAIYTLTDAEIDKTGSAVFGAKLFTEMIRRMPDGMVCVEVSDDNKATIKCGKSEYSFMAQSANDYPELPEADYRDAVSIPRKLLSEIIEKTVFAVSDNESRPVYTGSLFELGEGMLTVVSVDGYRLALRREPMEGATTEQRFIIPGSALQDIQRICSDGDEPVLINLGSKHVSFSIGSTVVISRRLDGDFLNYKKAVPESFRVEIKAERAELLSIVDRVSIVVDEKTRNPVRLIFGEDRIDFLCATPLGRAEDMCPCEGEGGELEIGFNDRYLRDALRAADGDKVVIKLNTGSSPCVIMPTEGDRYVYMILPVRLRPGD